MVLMLNLQPWSQPWSQTMDSLIPLYGLNVESTTMNEIDGSSFHVKYRTTGKF